MTPGVVLDVRFGNKLIRKSLAAIRRPSGNPTVLIATIDPDIREGLATLLESSYVNAIWVSSVQDVKALVRQEKIVACLCGFWLQDGTYREVIRLLRRERAEIPAIIVSAPACPQDYQEYLEAVGIGALDFLSYPYQQSQFERMLGSATGGEYQPAAGESAKLQYEERGAA